MALKQITIQISAELAERLEQSALKDDSSRWERIIAAALAEDDKVSEILATIERIPPNSQEAIDFFEGIFADDSGESMSEWYLREKRLELEREEAEIARYGKQTDA